MTLQELVRPLEETSILVVYQPAPRTLDELCATDRDIFVGTPGLDHFLRPLYFADYEDALKVYDEKQHDEVHRYMHDHYNAVFVRIAGNVSLRARHLVWAKPGLFLHVDPENVVEPTFIW